MSKSMLRTALRVLSASALAALAAASAPSAAMAVPAHPVISAARADAVKPMNKPDGKDQNFFDQAYPTDCARIDGEGMLIIGDGDCTTFEAVPYTGSSIYQILDVTSGGCLSYDQDGARDHKPYTYDINPDCIGDPSNEWEFFGASNSYSEWTTVYNNDRSDCMWEAGTGTGNPLTAQGCDGSSSGDRWHAADLTS